MSEHSNLMIHTNKNSSAAISAVVVRSCRILNQAAGVVRSDADKEYAFGDKPMKCSVCRHEWYAVSHWHGHKIA